MDKNTITGIVLIGLLLVGFSYFSRPSEEQIAAAKKYNDSIALVQQQQEALKAKTEAALANENTAKVSLDSTDLFFDNTVGKEEFTTIENELVKITLSNKGGRIYSTMLKEYNDQQKQPLVLFNADEAAMNFYFYDKKKAIQTKDLYFTPVNLTDSTVTMRLAADSASYVDFIYALHPGNYMLDFNIKATHMMDKLASTNYVNIEWQQRARLIERDHDYENRYANITYKLAGDNTDYLSATKDKASEKFTEALTWIAFKNQFFSAVWISDSNFTEVTLESKADAKGSGYLKDYTAEMKTAFDPSGVKETVMHMYFGPNHYKTLSAFDEGRAEDLELNELVDLGWPLIRWINQYFTINLFDWLSALGLNMGIILLIMTIIVKVLVYPTTYKSYISSAKMRVLKPKIEEINKKYPKQEDAMKKQQEVMGLYGQYGVSPMGGCLPMLIQFPVLMAMFLFIPSAIELRQQSFLWADDLSNYDAFINFGFHIPFLGSHLSLFCLLMTVTSLLNTKYTMDQQDTGQAQMAGMKWMMYLMPVMFLFILNGFPAGLNYYYFISTLVQVVTMIILRKTTDENKLLAQLEANREKNKDKKKTGFSARLEAMQKQQQELLKKQQEARKH